MAKAFEDLPLFAAPPEPASRRQSRADAVAKRDLGMARASQGSVGWSDTALAYLREYCLTHETVFCDDLWSSDFPEPREGRALGPILMKAMRLGWIEGTGTYRLGIRNNRSPRQVWRSLIFER